MERRKISAADIASRGCRRANGKALRYFGAGNGDGPSAVAAHWGPPPPSPVQPEGRSRRKSASSQEQPCTRETSPKRKRRNPKNGIPNESKRTAAGISLQLGRARAVADWAATLADEASRGPEST